MSTQKCPRCEKDCDSRAAFCPWCSRALARALPDADGALTKDPPSKEWTGRTGGVMTIGAAGQPIGLADGVSVVLGRAAMDSNIKNAMETYTDTSREHALLVVRGAHVEVRDLNSTHGTFVEEEHILTLLPTGGTQVLDLPAMIRLAERCYVWIKPQ